MIERSGGDCSCTSCFIAYRAVSGSPARCQRCLQAAERTPISILWRAATGCGSSGGRWRGRSTPRARRAYPPLQMRWRFARRGNSASGAAADEHADEIIEGIATYTQYVIASESAQDALQHAVARLAGAETGTSFVQTFAYASGAGYGLLLDAL